MPRKARQPFPPDACTRCRRRDPSVQLIARHGGSIVRQRLCSSCLADLAPRVPTQLHNRVMLDGRLRRTYGIGAPEYEAMLIHQDGRCAICGIPPEGNNDRRLAVDHDHKTGAVRGLLCDRCNLGLGYFKDNPTWVLKAAAYLAGLL